MILEVNTVKQKITDLLQERFNIPYELICTGYDKPLTGNDFCLNAADLVYLFFELEAAFQIRIKAEFLNDYQFVTVNKIAEVICQSS